MSIKKEMINGVFWTALQKYSGLIIQFLVTAVLARILSPTDFGIIAIASVLILFLNLLTEMGIGPAIIQNKTLTSTDLNNIFSATIYAGISLMLLLFGGAYLIASFYDNHLLIPICQILSINLFFAACNIVPNSLILKAKRFKFIAKRTLFLQVIGGIISVVAALNGLGVYSLLISPVFTAIGVFILNYYQFPLKFYHKINIVSLKKIYTYSAFQFLFNFFNFFSRNLDTLIIGKYLGLISLGYYEKSYRLMMLPMQTITNVITPVMHPILSSLQDNKSELTKKYCKIIKLLGTISFPLGATVFLTASEIIQIVYGNNWNNAIPVFKILALSLPFQMLLSSTGAIYQAAGATRWMFYNGLLNTLFTVSGFIISAIFFKTIESFAWAWNITISINIIISYFILCKKVLRTSILRVLKELRIPCVNFILILLIVGFLHHIILNDINKFITFSIKIISSILISIFCIQIGKQYDLYTLLRRAIKKI